MTETERINSTPLGQEVKRIMELVCMTPEPKQIWLIQYLKETAETALTNMWGGLGSVVGQIPADDGLLEVTMYLENSPIQYRELMQEEDDLGEEYWTPQFREMREKLETYLKENPLPAPAKWEFEEAMDNLMFENAWNLADGPLGELMQNLW
ncbi:MAG: hypothetical protein II979_03290 [Clostridia bacterium]|nr:hypothetical protein [Clostridia bacterium]